MLDWERWTLTHSSGGAVVPVLVLPLFCGLGLELGLAATRASSAAAVADVADVPDCEGDGEVSWEGGGEVVWGGTLLALAGGSTVVGRVVAAAEVLAGGLVEGEGDGDGEGEGERRGKGDGDGEGAGVPDDGSAWHTLSVFAVVAAGAACAACAVPSTPTVSKLPLSKVTAATLTCAKRIRIACLRCSSGLPCALRDSEATRGRMGRCTHFSANRLHMHHLPSGSQPSRPGPRPAGSVYPRQHGYDGLEAGSVPWRTSLVPVADGSAGNTTRRFA